MRPGHLKKQRQKGKGEGRRRHGPVCSADWIPLQSQPRLPIRCLSPAGQPRSGLARGERRVVCQDEDSLHRFTALGEQVNVTIHFGRIRVLALYYLDDAHRYMLEIVTASPPAGLPTAKRKEQLESGGTGPSFHFGRP